MIFSIAMDADYTFYVKTIETHARAILPLNISAIGTGHGVVSLVDKNQENFNDQKAKALQNIPPIDLIEV